MIKKTLKLFTFFFLLFSFHFSLISSVSAAEFNTSYDVLYDVGESGVTTVTEKISLRNLTSEYYANQFKLTIGATQISDVKASDEGGPLEVAQEQKDNITTLSVKFNKQIAGLGKTMPWTITFKSKDFAEKSGKVWEVRAPKISAGANLESYNLTLSVPQSFGDPSLISPTPKSQTVSAGKIFLTFDKDQLLTSGISANFGTSQIFDFDLSYHLENTSLVPILTTVALPPDTAYQDVIFQRIEPKPLNVTVDDDGNYLAWYRLARKQKMDVKVFGSSKLYTKSKVKEPFLEDSLRKKYTSSDKYWEKDNPQIVARLEDILKDSKTSNDKVKLIYQFVVNFLKYDSSRLKQENERFGAVTALGNPNNAVCMEFTDLFIALARAAGVPARELNGFAYTANPALRPLSLTQDILHAWPEYWDEKKGWVMVDPTWENTTGGVDYFSKLDLNHFTFVVKGQSSVSPIPAGSYKLVNESDSRDVNVSLSEGDFLGHPQIDVQIESPDRVWAGFPSSLKVKVINTGNSFYPSAPFQVSTNKIYFKSNEQKLGPVPAYGVAEFDYGLRTNSLFDSYDDQITVLVNGKKFTKDIKITPFVPLQMVPFAIGGILIFIVMFYSIILGVHFHQKKNVKKHHKK